MKQLPTLKMMTLFNSPRAGGPTGLRRAIALTLTLALVLVPLLGRRTLLPSAQAQVGTCGGPGRIFQGCPLGIGSPFEAGLENQSIDQLIALHKLPASDRGRILGWERGKVRALLFGKLIEVIKKAPASRTATEQAGVNAFAARIKQRRLDAARFAIEEYDKWNASPCAYTPPPGFSYSPGAACLPISQLVIQYGRPDPPKFEEFQAYGAARAYSDLRSQDAQFVFAKAARAMQIYNEVTMAGQAFGGFTSALGASAIGITALSAATGLMSAFAGAMGAIGTVIIAIVIGGLRGIDVFTAEAIPGKLQETKNNVESTPIDLAQLINSEYGPQEVYGAFIGMTLPDFPSSDPVPAQQASDPKFRLSQSGGGSTQDHLLRYKSWDNANHTARLNGGWFINKDAAGKEVWTLGIDYIDWNGEQWTASRSGGAFIHTKEGAPDRSFESPEIKYKDWNGANVTASRVQPALEITALPVVLDRGHHTLTTVPPPVPQTLPVALVNSAGQALNTLSAMVNDAASATTTGVTISNLSVDSAGQVTASLKATCDAGSPTFTLKVIDSVGQSKTTSLVIHLTPIYNSTINPLPATLPDGKVGVPYSAVLNPNLLLNCSAESTIHLTGGKLPFGLSFGDVERCSGVVCEELGFGATGTPTSGGSSTFSVTWSFSTGDTFSRTYTVNIASDPVEMPAGMVSWWNAEHGGNDIAERNHGQASNGFGPKDFEPGHVGLAFRFNGSSGAVRLPNNFFPFPASGNGNTPFTFETWFKTSSGGVIIGQQNTDPWGTTPSWYTPGLYVGTDGRLRAQMFWKGWVQPITSATAVNDDRFHHVAVVYDGSVQVVYLDGDEMGRVAHTQLGQSVGHLRYQFGTGYTSGWPGAPSGWFGFNGLIDEATLFDRALDVEEVRSIFAASQAGKFLFDLKVTNPLCRGDANGAVQINVIGGYWPLSYSTSIDVIHGGGMNFQPGNFFSGQPAGGYPFVGFRDGRGYEFGKAVILTDPETINLSPPSLAESSNLGQPFTQDFQASGGTGRKTLTLSGALPSGLTFTNDPANSAGAISGSPAQSGSFPLTLTATDQNGCAQSRSYTLVVNGPPTITTTPVTRTAGAPAANVQIGAVDDFEDANNALTVTVNGAASATVNGVTVSSIGVDASGRVTASVGAACGATDASFALRVTDSGGLFHETTLLVTVMPNTAPSPGYYPNARVKTGGGATITPNAPLSDNGSISSVTVTAPSGAGGVTVDPATGVVSISNAGPVGSFPITVKATDNCGATTTRTFLLTVSTEMSGNVAGWGYNDYGQVDIPEGLNDVTAIAAGDSHNLALKSDGTVVAWGKEIPAVVNIPAGLSDVTAIAAGNNHSLALKSDGAVVAWGNNSNGQLNIPAGLSDVTAIAAGAYYSLALRSDGAVAGWGANSYGQLNIPAGLSDVTAIAAGIGHGLALKSDGTVVAWGNNQYGQLNIPAGLRDVTGIAAGGYHSLALKSDGTVVAWGKSDNGQLNIPEGLRDVMEISGGIGHSLALKSDGTVVGWGDNYYYGQVNIPDGLNGVTAIAAGYYHSLALGTIPPAISGSVAGWGQNSAGQLNIPAGLSDVTATAGGIGHSLALKSDGTVAGWGDNYYGQVNIPAGLSGVTQIAAGAYYSLALKSDGTVAGWGANSYGQLNIPAGLSDVTAIAAGGYHNLALKSDGTVVAWGRNNEGQLNIPAGLRDVTAISAGYYHSLALKSDGTVVGWGYNQYGQLNIPAGLSGVTAISARYIHNLALKSDGTVVGWGYNYYGQLNIPAGLSGVTAIAAGNYHSLALKSDGTVVAWGRNNEGQLNIPAGLSKVTAISAGPHHSMALGTITN